MGFPNKSITTINTPNKNQFFMPIWPSRTKELYPFKASTVISDGCAIGIEIVSNTTTGNVTKMWVENVLGADFVGILCEPIAVADSDYATAGKLKYVWVPKTTKSKCTFAVGAGTFTLVDVYKTVEFHSDSLGLAVDTPGKGARIVWYISATQGVCEFSLPTTETA